jgi:hypothetical protein
VNSKDTYRKPIIKLMNFLKYKLLRIPSLLVIVPLFLLVAFIQCCYIGIKENLPTFLKDTKVFILDVAHWDELKDTREFGLMEKANEETQ